MKRFGIGQPARREEGVRSLTGRGACTGGGGTPLAPERARRALAP